MGGRRAERPRYARQPWEEREEKGLVMPVHHGREGVLCTSLCLSTMGERGYYAPHDRFSPNEGELSAPHDRLSPKEEKSSMRLMTVSHLREEALFAPHDRLSPKEGALFAPHDRLSPKGEERPLCASLSLS